uniref:DUF4349 domain-containing protein n=1 Tax=Parascaris univalens TaxID=6257 RepID=A0A915AMP6_PARUN
YIIGGAWLFYSLERPMELLIKEKTMKDLAYEKHNLLNNAIKLASYYEDFGAFNNSFLALLDDYELFLFEVFNNPISASVFENQIDDLWTTSSAILFTATTLVPVVWMLLVQISFIIFTSWAVKWVKHASLPKK